MRTARRVGVATCSAALLALGGLTGPASAGDDSEAASGGLEVEVRPAIAPTGGTVTVKAEFELDEDEDEDEDDSDEDEDEDGEDGGGEDGPQTGVGPASPAPDSTPATPSSVTLTIDYGDGSAVETMEVRGDSSDEVRAFGQHRYEAEGVYTVTVTADPGDGSVGETVSVSAQVGRGSARLGGRDRHETANRLSREDFPVDGEASAVLLARSDGFADALAAAPAALLEDAPVLLTTTADLPAPVHEEIARLLGVGGTVYLLGGEAAISSPVEAALRAEGREVRRISGGDRVETALEIARFLVTAGVDVDEVVLASSGNFPDALAGAAFAASAEAPVLLTPAASLDPRVAAFLAGLGEVEVHVAGGAAAVSDAVLQAVAGLGLEVQRLSGDDRYDTAAQVAERLFPTADAVVLATGGTFPDALAGAAAAGRRDAPVLLVGATLPEPVRDYLVAGRGRITSVYVLGGEAAVPAAVLAEVRAVLGL